MPFKPSEPSGTSQSICTRTFRNLPEYLRFHRLSARETSTTSPGICIGTLQNLTRYSICTETLRNLTSYLHLNFLEPSCAGTLCNLTGYLHWNPPKPHQVSAPESSGTSTGHLHRNPFGTLRNFARNLLLKLHRIAPELIWAKDPIATFCCWGITQAQRK